MPGKVVHCLKHTQSPNPLILIGEIAKFGSWHTRDPALALLELLDSSQHSGFVDRYMDGIVHCCYMMTNGYVRAYKWMDLGLGTWHSET